MKFVSVNTMRRAISPYIFAYWTDPETGMKRTKSLKTTDERTAERRAAQLETEINAGKSQKSERSWAEAIDAYRAAAFPALAANSRKSIETTVAQVESIIRPKSLAIFTEQRISDFSAALRKTKVRGKTRTEYTIRRHLSALRSILNWFHESGYLQRVPKIRMPNPHGSKGRALSEDEFQRMLLAVDQVVGKDAVVVQSWLTLLHGLWLSGLRLGEALALSWDDPNTIRADMVTYRHPMLVIPSHAQKSRTNTVTPITPDFADWLRQRPNQTGLVFSPLARSLDRIDLDWTSKIITRCGEMAEILVKDDGSVKKYASAHDLRRSFGYRWSLRVLPPDLQQLMRHADIKTTMEFYAGRNAESVAERLHDQFGVELGVATTTATRKTAKTKHAQRDSNPRPTD